MRAATTRKGAKEGLHLVAALHLLLLTHERRLDREASLPALDHHERRLVPQPRLVVPGLQRGVDVLDDVHAARFEQWQEVAHRLLLVTMLVRAIVDDHVERAARLQLAHGSFEMARVRLVGLDEFNALARFALLPKLEELSRLREANAVTEQAGEWVDAHDLGFGEIVAPHQDGRAVENADLHHSRRALAYAFQCTGVDRKEGVVRCAFVRAALAPQVIEQWQAGSIAAGLGVGACYEKRPCDEES